MTESLIYDYRRFVYLREKDVIMSALELELLNDKKPKIQINLIIFKMFLTNNNLTFDFNHDINYFNGYKLEFIDNKEEVKITIVD